MARRKQVKWGGWAVYFLGRGLELLGLFLVTASIFLFFGSSQMRPMLALTGAGGVLFVLGWYLARTDPEGKRS